VEMVDLPILFQGQHLAVQLIVVRKLVVFADNPSVAVIPVIPCGRVLINITLPVVVFADIPSDALADILVTPVLVIIKLG